MLPSREGSRWLVWIKVADSIEGEIRKGKKRKEEKWWHQGTHGNEKFLNVWDNFPWAGSLWNMGTVNASTQSMFSTPLGFCSLSCKWAVAAQIFSLVREKLTEHKAELLPQMPLTSESWVIVSRLLISQRPLRSFPVSAGSFLTAFIFAPPTQQYRQGTTRLAAKRTSAQLCKSRRSHNIVEKAKEHMTSSIQ